jgi:hypothetical protein
VSPASIAVDLERDILLLGGSDGSITEVSREGLFLQTVVPPGLIDGLYVPADRAIAVIPTLRLLYCAGDQFLNYPAVLHKYSGTGDRLGSYGLFGFQSFQDLVLERREPIGVLHMLNPSQIHSWTLDEDGDLNGTRYTYHFALPSGEHSALSGFVLLPEPRYFLLSLKQAQVLLVPVDNLSPRHGESVWLEVTGRIDLTPLGIGAVDDLAFDPVRQHLYLTDSSQNLVFELAFVHPAPFHRGDPDESGGVNLADAFAILNFLFLNGQAPGCLETADSNNDRAIDLSDAVTLLNFVLLDGPPPPAPGPPGSPCGSEPDPRDSLFGLGCAAYGRC